MSYEVQSLTDTCQLWMAGQGIHGWEADYTKRQWLKNLSATLCNTVPELRLQTAQMAWKASEILSPRTNSLGSRPHRHCTPVPPEEYLAVHSMWPFYKRQRAVTGSMSEMNAYRKLPRHLVPSRDSNLGLWSDSYPSFPLGLRWSDSLHMHGLQVSNWHLSKEAGDYAVQSKVTSSNSFSCSVYH